MKRAKKVISLVPRTPNALSQAETVGILAKLLEQAEDGDIVAVAVACVTAYGGGTTVISKADNVMTLAGTVARLQHRLQRSMDE